MIAAVAPVFGLILIGFGLRRIGFPGDDFWRQCERLVYYLLFPALLVSRLAVVPLEAEPLAELALALVVPTLAVSAGQLALRPWTGLSPAGFTSVFQGSIRFNTYIGLALGAALNPARGLALTALAAAILIPLVNLLCVSVLVLFGNGGRVGWPGMLWRGLSRNPLILACLAGVLLNLAELGLPKVIMDTAGLLGQTALPLGLLAVGAGLSLRISLDQAKALALSASAKLLVLPLMAWGLCGWMQADSEVTRIAVMFAALPTASSAYILAREMGGDHRSMAAIITLQTLLSMLSLPWLVRLAG